MILRDQQDKLEAQIENLQRESTTGNEAVQGLEATQSGWQNGCVCQELREEIADLRKKCHDHRNSPDRFRLKENPACKNNAALTILPS
jgi:hypothetical protein